MQNAFLIKKCRRLEVETLTWLGYVVYTLMLVVTPFSLGIVILICRVDRLIPVQENINVIF